MVKSDSKYAQQEPPIYIPDPPAYRRLEPSTSSPDEEALVRMAYTVLSREDTRKEIEALFTGGEKTHSRTRKEIEKLFVQAPIAQTSTPLLQKRASRMKTASKTEAFFEERQYLTEAQTLFPELMTVAGR